MKHGRARKGVSLGGLDEQLRVHMHMLALRDRLTIPQIVEQAIRVYVASRKADLDAAFAGGKTS